MAQTRKATDAEIRESIHQTETLWQEYQDELVQDVNDARTELLKPYEDDVSLRSELEPQLVQENENLIKRLNKEKDNLLEKIRRGSFLEVQSQLATLFAGVRAEQIGRTRALFENQAREVNAKIGKRIDRLQWRMENPKVIKLVDRFAFFMGVVGMLIIEAVALKSPLSMSTLYTWTVFPLLIFRYLDYHSKKYHYFMLDFCYVVQVCLLTLIHVFPSSRGLFVLCYSWSHGPLLWAVVLWQNSLVFHSVDKVTSSYIHLLPPLVMFCLRWYSTDMSFICGEHFSDIDCQGSRWDPLSECSSAVCSISLWDVYKIPLLGYVAWQIGYLVKTEVFDRAKLGGDEEIATSLRYLRKMYKGHWLYDVATYFGEERVPIMFMAIQLVYTCLTLLPVYLMFQSQFVNGVIVTAVIAISIWNGSTFYVYKFATIQQKTLEKASAKRAEMAEERKRKQEQGIKGEPTWFHTYIRRGRGQTNKSPSSPEGDITPNGQHTAEGLRQRQPQ